jgi:hypothetical protein
MILLSANGTLRTILILVLIWQVLRMVRRSTGSNSAGRSGQRRTGTSDQRPSGDVRIERANDLRPGQRPGAVEDADFEEIK